MGKAILFLLLLVGGGAAVAVTNLPEEYAVWIGVTAVGAFIVGLVVVARRYPRQQIEGGIEFLSDGIRWSEERSSRDIRDCDIEMIGTLYKNYSGKRSVTMLTVKLKDGTTLKGSISNISPALRKEVSRELGEISARMVRAVDVDIADNPDYETLKTFFD